MSKHIATTRTYSAECDTCGWYHSSWTTKEKAKATRDYHSKYCPEDGAAYVVER